MEHQPYELNEIKEFHKEHKQQFMFFAIPIMPNKFDVFIIGFHNPVASGILANSNDEPRFFKSLDLLLKYLNTHFNIDVFTVIINS